MRPDVEKDYYSILGAGETASHGEIERLYRRLAMRHHPDRGGDAEQMKAINEACRVLGNAATRHAYDSQPGDNMNAVVPPLSPPLVLLPNEAFGRLVGALLFLLAGLMFLFLERIYYIKFMWPIFLVAAFVVILGVWKVSHGDGLCTEECCVITSRATLHMGPGACVLVHGVRWRLRNLSPTECDLNCPRSARAS